MPPDLTPERIRSASFRSVIRGLDPAEVTAYLESIAGTLDELIAERDKLVARLGESTGRDLKVEFEDIGREVTAILETAREAAEAMRDRASMDAALWRSEALAEAENQRKDARNDAEALRGDAWATGTELLNHTMAEIKRMREEAERDVLTMMGEAEREAHRMSSSARREAEDLTRSASMDAEKMTSEALKRRDEILEQAHRQASAAEERTRALEARREELLEELENVRTTLGHLEGTLEMRRGDLELSVREPSTVRVVNPELPPGDVERTWALGETVRVVPPDRVTPAEKQEVVEVEPAPEELGPEPVADEPEPEIEPEAPGGVGTPTAPESKAEPVPAPEPPADDVDALFASLRGEPRTTTSLSAEAGPEVRAAPQPAPASSTAAAGHDWFEERDARLLPVTNRALRGVKKAVTDAQNVALDSLRTDPDWIPEPASLAEGMSADLKGLWAESFSAGHGIAEEMAGKRLKRPSTPATDAASEFGEELAEAVREALVAAGDGQRERQSATSRVFRAWRTDEAERRIRSLAMAGYHAGLVGAAGSGHTVAWVPAGQPCSACTEASEDPAAHLPPVHSGCECTLVII